MNYKIVFGQVGCFGDDIGVFGFVFGFVYQLVVEDILFFNKDDVVDFKFMFDVED